MNISVKIYKKIYKGLYIKNLQKEWQEVILQIKTTKNKLNKCKNADYTFPGLVCYIYSIEDPITMMIFYTREQALKKFIASRIEK